MLARLQPLTQLWLMEMVSSWKRQGAGCPHDPTGGTVPSPCPEIRSDFLSWEEPLRSPSGSQQRRRSWGWDHPNSQLLTHSGAPQRLGQPHMCVDPLPMVTPESNMYGGREAGGRQQCCVQEPTRLHAARVLPMACPIPYPGSPRGTACPLCRTHLGRC